MRPYLFHRGICRRLFIPNCNPFYHSVTRRIRTTMSTKSEPSPLSAAEFRDYNKMAQEMDRFVRSISLSSTRSAILTQSLQHQHFRTSWETLHSAASSGARPPGLSLRQFLSTGLRFCYLLELHHSLEEQYIFPYLAQRMPAFRTELELLAQHKQIHAGLDKLNEYLE